MTVSTESYRNAYAGDGVATVFNLTFRLIKAAHLNVYVAGVLQVTTAYTVLINADGVTGTVTFNAAPANGAIVLLQRNMDYLQEDDLANNGALPADTIERMIDKLTMIMQQLKILMGFSLSFPITSDPAVISGALAAPVAGALIAVNAAGTGGAQIAPGTAGYALLSNGAGLLPSYQVMTAATGGNVVGPATSVDWTIPLWNGTLGRTLRSGVAAVGAAGQVLTSNGAGVAPSFQAVAASGGGKFAPGHRLTLLTNDGAPAADQSAKGTLYLTPFYHNQATLKYGGVWSPYEVDEISLALTATSGNVYAVYLYATSASAAALEIEAWTNTTTRATAIVIDADTGLPTKSGDPTRVHVGDFQATGANQATDALGTRKLCNVFNRVMRPLKATMSGTASWTFASTTARAVNANSTDGQGRVSFLLSHAGYAVNARYQSTSKGSVADAWGSAGIGLDSTTVQTAEGFFTTPPAGGLDIYSYGADYSGFPGLGSHFLQALEDTSSGTLTTYGVLNVAESSYMTGGILM